ncbi:MAG: hypothetical protein ACRDSP_19990 [Pseudonocardiaceae bacterium]
MYARTGWSRKELARRVNQRAQARGVHLHTDASRVRNWPAGQQPQPPVPELLSELFSGQVGYPVIPVDIQESGDATLGANVLATMADQALLLGYPREALQLASTGHHGLARSFSPACAARLLALQARAHAVLGNTTQAAQLVVESERALERIDAGAELDRAGFIDETHLSGLWADAFVDLQRPSEATRFARRSISAAAGQNRARRETLSQVALARAGLIRRDLDAALRAAHRAVDLSTNVQSSRCLTAVRDLRSRISPYRTVTAAREFDDRAREVLTRPHLN